MIYQKPCQNNNKKVYCQIEKKLEEIDGDGIKKGKFTCNFRWWEILKKSFKSENCFFFAKYFGINVEKHFKWFFFLSKKFSQPSNISKKKLFEQSFKSCCIYFSENFYIFKPEKRFFNNTVKEFYFLQILVLKRVLDSLFTC